MHARGKRLGMLVSAHMKEDLGHNCDDHVHKWPIERKLSNEISSVAMMYASETNRQGKMAYTSIGLYGG